MAPKPASRAMQPTAASSNKTSPLEQLKTNHAAEMQKMRVELDTLRTQSTKLETVEAKIKAVEDALRDSKTRAIQKEQELHRTIQKKDEDRNQLGQVVEELKEEIDRCQVQLDEDAKKQAEEKKTLKKAKLEAEKRAEDAEKRAEAAEKQAKDGVKRYDDLFVIVSDLRKKVTEQEEDLKELAEWREVGPIAAAEGARLKEEAEKAKQERDLYQQKLEDAHASESSHVEKLTTVTEEMEKARLEVEMAEKESQDAKEVMESLQDKIQELQVKLIDMEGTANQALAKNKAIHERDLNEAQEAHNKNLIEAQEAHNKSLIEAKEAHDKTLIEEENAHHETEKARLELEIEAKDAKLAMESLQDEIQVLQLKLVDAQATKDQALAEADEAHTNSLTEAKAEHHEAMVDAERQYQSQLQDQDKKHSIAMNDMRAVLDKLENAHASYVNDTEAKHEKEMTDAKHQYQSQLQEQAKSHSIAMSNLRAVLDKLENAHTEYVKQNDAAMEKLAARAGANDPIKETTKIASDCTIDGTTSIDKDESIQAAPGGPRKLSDPFLKPARSTTHISTDNAISNGITQWDGKMTLEGTLESLRVQTEQLMELNDDFLAENRRIARSQSRRDRSRSSKSTTPTDE